ncbi:hypothetical protein L484_013440 [Morus notabilis]|uniref:Uncharacterized protein n=1 Tax=Morus notabilis TaxID=981085 RepID=W9RAR7_9ROSA|nr:hypothetical protein L484_013440 [Morus notabilis]
MTCVMNLDRRKKTEAGARKGTSIEEEIETEIEIVKNFDTLRPKLIVIEEKA